MISLRSPYALLKPDCACVLRRKATTTTTFDAEEPVLSSPVYLGIITKYGHCSRISAPSERNFLCSPDCAAEEGVSCELVSADFPC